MVPRWEKTTHYIAIYLALMAIPLALKTNQLTNLRVARDAR